MLNCTDIECILHHNHYYQHLHQMQHHLQDHREHHAMSGEAGDIGDLASNLNGTGESEIAGLSHVDAPSDSVYIVCGVLIAMVLVAAIIILLAVFISKLRKRDENGVRQDHVMLHSAQQQNNNHCHHNNNNNNSGAATPPTAPTAPTGGTTIPTVSATVIYPPAVPSPADAATAANGLNNSPRQFIWQIPATHPYAMYKNDKETLVHPLPSEQPGFCRGFRKNLQGRWKRLVKRKPINETYTIPPELRDQLKNIYVY